MGLRETAKRKRRRRILTEARRLIDEEGLEGLSMRRLAESAELSTRTLYNLYGAKETILFALMEESLDQLDETLEQLGPTDPIDRSRTLITASVEMLCGDAQQLHRSLLRELDLNPRLARELLLMGRVRSWHEEALRSAMHAGLLDASFSAQVLAHQVLMGYGQAVRLWSRGIFDAHALRAQALHVWALHLLAVSTDASRPQLRAEVLQLRGEIERVLGRLERIAAEGHEVSASFGPPPEVARASGGS